MKLRTKLVLSNLLLVASTIVVAVIGLTGLNVVFSNGQTLYQRMLIPTSELLTITETFQRQRINIRDYIDAINPTDQQGFLDNIRTLQASQDEAAASFEKTILTDTGRKFFEAYQGAVRSYRSDIATVQELMKTGERSYAREFLWTSAKKTALDLQSAIDGLVRSKLDLAAKSEAENESTAAMLSYVVFGVSLWAILSGLVVASILASGVTKRIGKAVALMRQLAEGDLTLVVSTSAKDELGQLEGAIATMSTSLRERIATIARATNVMQETSEALVGGMTGARTVLGDMQQSLDQVADQVVAQSASVTETAATSNQIFGNLVKLNTLVEDQAANISETSASVEQMIANIRSVSNGVGRMREVTQNLKTATAEGAEKLAQATQSITRANGQAESLETTNKTVKEIASQTNLLAMNAAIEAAHAGEAGRGFSVVADEVRRLAEDATVRSSEIARSIKEITQSLGASVESSRVANEAFRTITDLFQVLAQSTDQITYALEEQSSGSQQILLASQHMNEITGQVKAGSAEMVSGSNMISQEMGKLLDQSERTRNETGALSRATNSLSETMEEVRRISDECKQVAAELGEVASAFRVQ